MLDAAEQVPEEGCKRRRVCQNASEETHSAVERWIAVSKARAGCESGQDVRRGEFNQGDHWERLPVLRTLGREKLQENETSFGGEDS